MLFETISHSSGLSHIAVNFSLELDVLGSFGKIRPRDLPTAVKSTNPDVAIALVINPKTPKGAKRIMLPVIFIITSKEDVKKFRKKSECLVSIRVSPTPRKMAKKIIPSISPEDAA